MGMTKNLGNCTDCNFNIVETGRCWYDNREINCLKRFEVWCIGCEKYQPWYKMTTERVEK